MHLTEMARRATKNKRMRAFAALAIVALTIGLIVRFFIIHPGYLQQFRHVNIGVVMLVILLNIPAMASLIWVYDSLIRLCGARTPLTENALLTAYSSISNFFGPLQSGPAVRTLYLKARYSVRIRDYTLATFVYFGFYAFFSALFLVAGVMPWWQTILILFGVTTISVAIIQLLSKRRKARDGATHFALRSGPLISLCIATFLQLVFIGSYYFVELKTVNSHIGVSQAISYSGAANFALFVSITPDAIGFREAFLVFSKHFHHVSTANILGANLIDRGAYLIFLSLLFIVALSVHAKSRLGVTKLQK